MSMQMKCYECGMCADDDHVCEDIKELMTLYIQMCKDRGIESQTAAEMMEEMYYKPLREEKEMNDTEYENDVLISKSCGLCTICDEWVQMNKFVGPDTADFEKNGPSQPCYQCRLYCSMNIEEEDEDEE